MAYPKNLEERLAKRGPVTTKEFKGALKSGGKMAAEELLMSVIPIARIGKLAKLIKGLGKGKKAPKKGELKSMLEERGFKKLASVDPTLNELEVFLKKYDTRGNDRILIGARESGEKSLKTIRKEAKELAEDGEPGLLELETGSLMLTEGIKKGSASLKERGKAMLDKSNRKKALAKMVRKAAESKAKK